MEKITVSQLIKQPIWNKYIYIKGYCCLIQPSGFTVINDNKLPLTPFIILTESELSDSDIFSVEENEKTDIPVISLKTWTNKIIENFFRKTRSKKMKVGLVARFGWESRLSWRHSPHKAVIDNILKVELLDDKDHVINSIKVGESSMPKELRGKL